MLGAHVADVKGALHDRGTARARERTRAAADAAGVRQ